MDVPIEDIINVELKQADPEKTGMAAGIGVLGAVLIAIIVGVVAVLTIGLSY